MESLESELARARAIDVSTIADAIESIGFECTDCGLCCRGIDDEHTATVFPHEIRTLESATDSTWRDVARPMPYGLSQRDDGVIEGETFEWVLQTNDCGDCVFYDDGEDDNDEITAPGDSGKRAAETGAEKNENTQRGDKTERNGGCTVYDHRPMICRTYPFSIAFAGTSQPMGTAVDSVGIVQIHECEGLGRDIDRSDAEELARTLKTRTVRELEEAIGVRDAYNGDRLPPGSIIVYDSEGAKTVDGAVYTADDESAEDST